MKMRIWLASATVVILILLLALTVNHAREKDMVELFSRQQLVHAQNTATRLADILSQIEKNIALFSHIDPQVKISSDEIENDFQILYSGWKNVLNTVVLLNSSGKIKRIFPAGANPAVSLTEQFFAVKKKQKQYLGLALADRSRTAGAGQKTDWYLIAGYPIWQQNNNFAGAWIFSFSLTNIVENYERQTSDNELGYLWLMDENGQIIIHPDPAFMGKNVNDLLRMDKEAKLDFSSGRGDYFKAGVRQNNKQEQKSVIAWYPLTAGDKKWVVLIVAPYSQVVSPVRKTFVYTLFSSLLLILVVVIASMSFAYKEGKRLRVKEENKRLREREDWQEKLLREKKTIDGIIEGSPIPMFVIDREHKVILWNRACEELTGYKAREMIGTDKQYLPFYSVKRPVIADLIADSDFEGLNEYYGKKKVKKSDKVKGAYEATDKFDNLGGRSRYLYFLAAPIYDEKGEIIAAIETLQDVSREEELTKSLLEYTESMQDELVENIKLRQEVEDLNNYLQTILKSLPEKIFELDSQGVVNYVSRGLKKKEDDKPYPEIKGKHFLDFIAPEDKAFALAKWEEAKRGVYRPYEVVATAKDGRKINLLITTSPVIGTDRYIVVRRDITEFKNLEKKLYESQKLAALGQFSAGIAHEVRNPLSSIKMSLQILEKRINPAGNDLKRFKIAEKEVEHLEELVNNVLVFAKPVEPRIAPTDLAKVLDQALAMTERGIADKRIDVQTKYDAIPQAPADAAMMVDAFLNIIRNAVDAVEENGSIMISLGYLDGSLDAAVIKIKDNGCGIDAEDMPHLFNPFFTRKKYGTGLGLSQVKKIIDLHQGSIDITSEKEKGTTVLIIVPLSTEKTPRLTGPDRVQGK